MLSLSRREDAGVSVGEIDDVLASLVDSLEHCSDPFDRFRVLQAIDVQLDRRLTVMAQGNETA